VKNKDAGGKDSRPMDDDDDSNETRRFPTAFFPRKQRPTHTVEQEKDLFSKSKYQLENASGNSENRDLQLPPAPATQRL